MPMTTSEPTAGELIEAMRRCKKDMNCGLCPLRRRKCSGLELMLADRLERQEQTISALTARAEQAERERDSYMGGLEDALRQRY